MFSPKQLLINCITLLSLEHREGVATSPSTELINNVLTTLPLPETSVDHDHGRQTFLELRQAVKYLNGRSDDDFPPESKILQDVQVACREESFLYEALMNAIMERHDDVKTTVKVIQKYRSTLARYINEENIKSIVKEHNHKLMFRPHEVSDIVDEVVAMGERLAPYIEARSSSSHPSMTGSMDFGDPENLSEYFENVKTTMSAEGAIRFGWKGLNRALGKVGAIKRGEFGLVGGLVHNFKSGFMMSLFTHAALFNEPFMRDSTRKPLLYFVSFENEIPDNLLWIYKYLKENETGEAVIDSEVNSDEAAAYVSEKLRATGFEIRMDRFDPSEFTVAGFLATLDAIYADGYEIQLLVVDYLNMLSKSGIDAKIAGDDIRFLFRRVRNYCSPRGIAFITPHQLSSEAQQLTRDNVEDFVKVIAGKGYYDGCKRLGQEPDLELLIHIVRVNNEAFLTIQRGKHRNAVTPEKDQYVVLPFKQVGTIPWDLDKDYEATLAMPGGGEIGSGEEIAWWAA